MSDDQLHRLGAEFAAVLRAWRQPALANRAACAIDVPSMRAVLAEFETLVAAIDGDAPPRPQSMRAEVFIYDARMRAIVAALRGG